MKVGDYPLELPDFWHTPGEVHSQPGLHRYNVAALPGVSFDFFVFEGEGADLERRARLVAAQLQVAKPARHREERDSFQGVNFELHVLDDCAGLGPGVVYELHVCEAFGDLLLMGSGYAPTVAERESLRLLFRTMLVGAIVRHGPPKKPAPKRRGWLDFLRR